MAPARLLVSVPKLAVSGPSTRRPALPWPLRVGISAAVDCRRYGSSQPAPGESRTLVPRTTPAKQKGSASNEGSKRPPRATGQGRKNDWVDVRPRGGAGAGKLRDVKVLQNGGTDLLALRFRNRLLRVPLMWLRDSCPCPSCVSPSSGQKTFASPDVPLNPKVASMAITRGAELEVTWQDDLGAAGKEHKSLYPIERIAQEIVLPTPQYRRGRPQLWNKAIYGHAPKFASYDEWIAGGAGFHRALADLDRFGLLFLRGVPRSESSVEEIVGKVGHLQMTFYGRTWDVISKPEAENVAYTNEFLGLHHDLMYIGNIPEIQVLHCLENDAEGGESMFSDGLRAAMELYHTAPRHFKTLSEFQVPYKYVKGAHRYDSALPVVDWSHDRVRAINWSPPFQDVFHKKQLLPDGTGGWVWRPREFHWLADWWRAAKAFKDNLESSANMLEYKLKPGECVLFNNRRVLHGRRQFDLTSGRRWLKGGYIESKVFLSKLRETGVLDEDPLRGLPDEKAQALAIVGPAKAVRRDAAPAPASSEKIEGGAAP